MGKYEDITQARKVLGIDESETLKNIKNKFNQLIKKYHPDVCKMDKEICRKKSEEIINSYKVVMNYCDNYRFSFNKKEVEKYLSREEFWKKKFGNDPIWSSDFDKNKDF